MKKIFLALCLACLPAFGFAQGYTTVNDVPYVSQNETDMYRKERCKLDVYYPEGVKNFPTIVWFHGGGLESGNKSVPEQFKEMGIAVVAVNYRLYPKVKNPGYIEDAAQAVAWTLQHIAEYGGNPNRVYVSGHSAGGYLALILATDKKWMEAYGADCDKVRCYLPVSGQTVTHFTIRKERGLPNGIPIIDEYAPVNKTRKDTAPIYLITGGRDLEMADRWEENALFASVSKNIGNTKVTLHELEGFDHNTVLAPACLQIVSYIQKDNPNIMPLYLVQIPGLEQPAFTPYRYQQATRNPEGLQSNFTPTFFVYPDKKVTTAEQANALIEELGLRTLYNDYNATIVITGPAGETYDAQKDLAAYDSLYNYLRVIGNLKLVGIGQGATFVNQTLAQHAGEVAGIFTYGGKPGTYKTTDAVPVPAFVAGTGAKNVAKMLVAQNEAKLVNTSGAYQTYVNAEEPLQQVIVSTAAYGSAREALADAWDKLLRKNYRFGNVNHTWYTGAKRGQYPPFELEPCVYPNENGVVRTVHYKDIPGKDTKYLWYEYFPQGTGDEAGCAAQSIPLMILLHGNTNDPRTQAETSGFIELCAEEKFAVAELEWQGNGFEAMGLDGIESTILGILKAHPQLDPSRVYAEGLSAGSFTASTLGVHSSHLFAAVGGHSGGLFPSGMPLRIGMDYDLLLKMAQQKRGFVEMPYCSICGTEDDAVIFPKPDTWERSTLTYAWKMYQTLNNLPVLEKLDFNVDSTFGMALKNRQHLETNKHISLETGELQNAAGVPLIKVIAVNQFGHWNFKPTARLMWNYYKQFRRDQQTGKLVVEK